MKYFISFLKKHSFLLSIFLLHHSIIHAQNVGIGTLNPQVPFEVVSSGSDTAVAQFTNNNNFNFKSSVIITNKYYGGGLKIDMNSPSNSSRAIEINHKGSSGYGIVAFTNGTALYGETNNISYTGVYGYNTYGEAVVGICPKGAAGFNGDPGVGAVVGRNDSSGCGVRGFCTGAGIGVVGQSMAGGTGNAGKFINSNTENISDVLVVNNIQNATGDCITATQRSTSGVAIRGISTGISSVAIQGEVGFGAATGVKGLSSGNNGTGVIGEANVGSSAYGIWGKSTSGYAGFFSGNVHVNGTLSKSMGTFKIDHPQDPANKFLVHSFVESPDMINIYNGNITTDKNGKAIVKLPGYFEAENIDFKYQLTIIDQTQFAQARISEKISNNEFTIMTDKPGIEVSWMVTGIRNDAYAKKHKIIPELEKSREEKGKYLNAIENDQPVELSMDYIKPVIHNTKQVVVLTEDTKSVRKKLASDK